MKKSKQASRQASKQELGGPEASIGQRGARRRKVTCGPVLRDPRLRGDKHHTRSRSPTHATCSDLVERLRDGGVPDHNVFPLRCEAADEIGRLRSDNKLLQEDLDRCRAFYDAWMTARRALGGK